MRILTLAALLFASSALAQGIPIKAGSTSDLLEVSTKKAAQVQTGLSARPTYACTATGLATTALYNMTVESSAGTGFRLLGWCATSSPATAAAVVAITVNRKTTASSAGTLVANEATATPSVSKMDPGDASFGGICRVTSTLGTNAALIDAANILVPAGVTVVNPPQICQWYGQQGGKAPVIQAGITNGVTLNVGAAGAGGLNVGAITMYFTAE